MEISQEGISPIRNGEYSRYGKMELRRLVVKFVHFMAKNQYTSTKYQLNPKFQYSNNKKGLEVNSSSE